MGKVFDVMKERQNERPLDIHDYMVKHPSSTFFMKMEEEGPDGTDIKAGDVLVVDRSMTAKKGTVVVMIMEGELKVEKLSSKSVSEDTVLWGVVTGILRQFH